jgi:hypothetical protein
MGREARVFRDRRCKNCTRPILSTAAQMQNHSWMCKFAGKLGLVLPTLERPTSGILGPDGRPVR